MGLKSAFPTFSDNPITAITVQRLASHGKMCHSSGESGPSDAPARVPGGVSSNMAGKSSKWWVLMGKS